MKTNHLLTLVLENMQLKLKLKLHLFFLCSADRIRPITGPFSIMHANSALSSHGLNYHLTSASVELTQTRHSHSTFPPFSAPGGGGGANPKRGEDIRNQSTHAQFGVNRSAGC